MKRVFKILTLLLMLPISSCGPGFLDESRPLGDGYVFRVDGSNRYIYQEGDMFEECIYPQVTDYNFNDLFITIRQRPDQDDFAIYFSNNLAAKFRILEKDSNYVHGSKKTKSDFTGSIWWKNPMKMRIKKVLSQDPYNSKGLEAMVDSVAKADPYFKTYFKADRFWIIDKKKHILFGPMDFPEYQNLEKKFSLPNDLKLSNGR